MSYNRRSIQKRGTRVKTNYTENLQARRPNSEIPSSISTRSVNSFGITKSNLVTGDSKTEFYEDPKTVYLVCKYYLGNSVTIKTDNDEYHGILKAVSPNGDFCLSEVTIFLKNADYYNRNEKFKVIPINNIRVVEVKEADPNSTPLDNNQIPTDEEIANQHRSHIQATNENSGGSDIELTPFYDSSAPSDDCLNVNKIGAHWFPPEEMFEKNKVSFNVQSTYSENLEGYTTQLHKDDPNYDKEIRMAQKKAEEIERTRDRSYDDLENRDEFEDDEQVYCSVARTNKLCNVHLNTLQQHQHHPQHKLTHQELHSSEHKVALLPHHASHHLQQTYHHQQIHNLNPNAREFTPTTSNNPLLPPPNIPFEMLGPISFQFGNLSLHHSHSGITHQQINHPAIYELSGHHQHHPPPPPPPNANFFYSHSPFPHPQRHPAFPPAINLPPGIFYGMPHPNHPNQTPQFIVPANANFDPGFIMQQQFLQQQHWIQQQQQQQQQQQLLSNNNPCQNSSIPDTSSNDEQKSNSDQPISQNDASENPQTSTSLDPNNNLLSQDTSIAATYINDTASSGTFVSSQLSNLSAVSAAPKFIYSSIGPVAAPQIYANPMAAYIPGPPPQYLTTRSNPSQALIKPPNQTNIASTCNTSSVVNNNLQSSMAQNLSASNSSSNSSYSTNFVTQNNHTTSVYPQLSSITSSIPHNFHYNPNGGVPTMQNTPIQFAAHPQFPNQHHQAGAPSFITHPQFLSLPTHLAGGPPPPHPSHFNYNIPGLHNNNPQQLQMCFNPQNYLVASSSASQSSVAGNLSHLFPASTNTNNNNSQNIPSTNTNNHNTEINESTKNNTITIP